MLGGRLRLWMNPMFGVAGIARTRMTNFTLASVQRFFFSLVAGGVVQSAPRRSHAD
jgi:hypothetical protein